MESNEHTQQRASVDPHDPMVGRILDGRYRIDSRIARGGMAAVYVAHDLRLDRTVAVKVMHPGMGEDPTFVERFVREARAAAQLTHPNVVAVHDQGDDNGTLFLAMEFVPGVTLRDVIRDEAPMTPVRALAHVEPILSALSAAHRAGLVHRDVKPENVLITPGTAGEPPTTKVADFGLAKAVNSATQHTATGVVIGSVSYLAPELVVKGHSDQRVDVYAVGVVLFELLTGRKPHEGESPIQIAYSHVHEDVPAPSTLVGGLPGYVDALVARATARDVDQRPSDASVLLHHVRRVAQALREGVAEDADLESDLRPHLPVEPLDVELQAELSGIQEVEEPDVVLTAGDALRPSRDSAHGDGNGHGDGRGTGYGAPDETSVRPPVVDESEHTQRFQAAPPSSTTRASAAAPGSLHGSTPGADATLDEGHLVRRLPAPSADLGAPPRPRRTRSRRGPLVALLAVLVAVAVGTGAWWWGFGRYETTPSVVELTLAQATEELRDGGFEVVTGDPAYSEDVPKGQVVDTSPAPGDRILAGDPVTLVLSLGPERYEVPDLTNLSLDEAGTALGEVKLEIGREDEKFHDTVEKGKVISSEPTTGTVVRPGTAVKVVVSKGRKPVEVTDFTGKAVKDARKTLEGLGLKVEEEKKFSDTVAENTVISQAPRTGTLFKGDTVKLVVSRGPELVTVPDVRRQGLEDARNTLEKLGFKVATTQSAVYLGLQYVASSDPAAGTKARKGSTITLSLV